MSAPEPETKGPSDDEAFFVGYLPMPTALKRFHGLLVPLAVVLVIGCAAWLAHSMTPVRARFQSQPQMLTGLFRASPAPILWVNDAAHASGVRGVLLVEGGKFGLRASLSEALDEHVITVAGTLLARDGLAMLELAMPPAESRLEDALLAPLAHVEAVSRGHVHLRGELVDSKCWLGRMRPGVGRTHRACAQQCVAGGIPPILVTRDASGAEIGYVLADVSDATLNDILPLLADSVEVEGELFTIGSLWMLRLDPASLRRL